MRKTAFLVALALIVALFAGVVPAQAQTQYAIDFEEYSEAVYMVNLDTGTVVYEKNAQEQRAPASLTKLMTMILAIENCEDLDNTLVTAPSYIWNEFEGINISHADIRRGETLSMRQLIYCMALQSANEAANIVAAYLGDGDISDFVAMMNDKAKEIGAVNTHFVNPHGLYDSDHYTTAYDMYLIAKYAYELDGFMDYVTVPVLEIGPTHDDPPVHESLVLTSTNKMMFSQSDYYYEPIRGMKTGTLDESGRCFVSTATKNGFTYLLVLMGAPLYDENGEEYEANNAFLDAKNFYEWAFNTFRVKTLLEKGKNIGQIGLELCWGKDYLLVMSAGRYTALLPDEVEATSVVLEPVYDTETVRAPLRKGDKVGQVRLMLAGEEIGRVDLVSAETVEQNRWLYYLDEIKTFTRSFWFKFAVILLALLTVFYIALMVIRNRRKRRYRGVRPRKRL
ncbi:MAG: D-alanyl-D-alanine carboxypeptidase [Oscillospiraceae bacterium]|nr:D-alanyl-D-alanine carboxypeptidase [Oscillospiraceae bacterium]